MSYEHDIVSAINRHIKLAEQLNDMNQALMGQHLLDTVRLLETLGKFRDIGSIVEYPAIPRFRHFFNVEKTHCYDGLFQTMTLDDKTHALNPKEAILLELLIAYVNTPITAKNINSFIWESGATSSTIATTVHRLRQKIEVDPKNPTYLLNTDRNRYILLIPDYSREEIHFRPPSETDLPDQ